MKLLLDTHVLLWAAASPSRLSEEVRDALEDAEHDVLVSAVSGWETWAWPRRCAFAPCPGITED